MKNRPQTLVVLTTMIACLAFYGCDENKSDTPTAQEYDDVAKSFGTVVVTGQGGGDLGSIHDAAALSVGVIPFGFAFDASGAVNGNRVGVDYAYSISCNDSAGNELSLCNSTTDSARVTVDWSGDLSIPPTFMASFTRSGVWRLSDIQSGMTRLDGESEFDFEAAFTNDSVSREYHFSYSGVYDDIQIRPEAPRVVGGSIRFAISADHRESNADGGHSSRTFDVTAELTFDAQGHATFVLDGQRTYDLDLVDGSVALHVGP